jgi:hypothetical protein
MRCRSRRLLDFDDFLRFAYFARWFHFIAPTTPASATKPPRAFAAPPYPRTELGFIFDQRAEKLFSLFEELHPTRSDLARMHHDMPKMCGSKEWSPRGFASAFSISLFHTDL